MRRTLPLLLVALTVPACQRAPAPAPVANAKIGARRVGEFDDVLRLIRDRLAVMHDVARWKWSAGKPIEDPGREASLLREVSGRGVPLGLDPATTRAFFAAQIEAAKLLQRADFARWESGQGVPSGEAPDLSGVLRPRIDALNRDLLDALAGLNRRPPKGPRSASVARLKARAGELVTGDGIDDRVRAASLRPLVDADE